MSKKQKAELAKFYIDISKLLLGTLVIGIFTNRFGLVQVLVGIAGLTASIFFLRLGLKMFGEIE